MIPSLNATSLAPKSLRGLYRIKPQSVCPSQGGHSLRRTFSTPSNSSESALDAFIESPLSEPPQAAQEWALAPQVAASNSAELAAPCYGSKCKP